MPGSCADQPGVVTQCRGHDRYGPGRVRRAGPAQQIGDRLKEQIADQAEPAADHQHLRGEHPGQVDRGPGDPADLPVPDAAQPGIPGADRGDNTRAVCAHPGPGGLPDQGRPGGHILDRGGARPGPQAFRVQDAVADLGQRPAPVHELAAEHHPGSDPGGNGQVGDIGPVPAGPQPGLAHGRQVGVVRNGDRDPGGRGQVSFI